MKIKLLSIISVAVLLLSSCVSEKFPVEGGSVRATMESDQTRTAVTDEGHFTWSAGDQVWLHTTKGSVAGTLSSGAGTASANFSYGSYFGEMTGKAVNPYNSGHSISGDVLNVVMPSSYDLGTELSSTNAAMYGENVNGNIRFNHLAGVMRFKFNNVPAGVNKFVLTLDKKINGTFAADLTEDYPVIEAEEASSDEEKTITLNFDALTEVSNISLYVPLPLGTYNSLSLALMASDEEVWTKTGAATNTINRKTLLLMPTVTLAGSISGDIEGSDNTVDLSESGTANSYIVSESGSYSFSPTKGNSSESVGTISSVEVLWETFGTSETPSVGSLISSVSYADGKISFSTPQSYREGNAVIAAKNSSGTILWSWHIWLTDEPEGQVYYNNAGTMMDRNLGATSATPGDVGALGLLYQWGRKDPFLGSSSISSSVEAKSTLAWPSVVSSDSSTGTIDYATEHPTTFIKNNSNNYDWYYAGSSSTDNTRWQSSKTIYDPCPQGWRVPDGGSNGVWSTALGYSSDFVEDSLYDSTNAGMNFSGRFGSASTIWYPASSCRYGSDGSLNDVGTNGSSYWSASSYNHKAYALYFYYIGLVHPSYSSGRATGYSVRCLQE